MISIPWRSFAQYIRATETPEWISIGWQRLDDYSVLFLCEMGFGYYRSWVFQSQGSKYPSVSKFKWNAYQMTKQNFFLICTLYIAKYDLISAQNKEETTFINKQKICNMAIMGVNVSIEKFLLFNLHQIK